MSNCNCKAELASIVREVVNTDPFATGSRLFSALAKRLEDPSRLAPPPATDWREKCFIPVESYGSDFFIAYADADANKNEPTHWLCTDGRWHGRHNAISKMATFPTREAARAALAAAPEPGVSMKDIPAKTDSSPDPAVFDAEKVAGDLWSDIYHFRRPNNIDAITAALRAAESAGYARAKAEQTQPAAPAAAKEGT